LCTASLRRRQDLNSAEGGAKVATYVAMRKVKLRLKLL